MKAVISEDNLSTYFLEKKDLDLIDISKLNRKIKTIKSALKLAEKHNEQLHLKIKNMKENHQLELIHLQTEAKKYKHMYDMLVQSYELRGLELKEYKKKYKKLQIDNVKIDEDQEMLRQYKQSIYKQQKQIIRLKQQNRLLYEQIYQKNSRLKELQNFISKNYIGTYKVTKQDIQVDQKDRSFLANIKSAIESRNEQHSREKGKLFNLKSELQKQNGQLSRKLSKITTQLDYEKKSNSELKDKISKIQKQSAKLAEQNKSISTRYQQLLNFSYDIQKQFQKELLNITKDISKKETQR